MFLALDTIAQHIIILCLQRNKGNRIPEQTYIQTAVRLRGETYITGYPVYCAYVHKLYMYIVCVVHFSWFCWPHTVPPKNRKVLICSATSAVGWQMSAAIEVAIDTALKPLKLCNSLCIINL